MHDIPFDLVTSVLQRIADIEAVPVARRKSMTTTTQASPRDKSLSLLKPLFALNGHPPEARTRIRIALIHLLLPHLDSERRYDLKEVRLRRALADELGLDGQALATWDQGPLWGGQYARREIPVCLGEVVGREWERRRERCNSGTKLTLIKVDTLLTELATHSRWSSARTKSLCPRPRPIPIILQSLFPPSLTPFQAALITQLILRDITPILAPPPTAKRTDSLLLYDSKSRYMLDLHDVLDLAGGREALYVWRRRGDITRAMEGLEELEEGAGEVLLKVSVNVQIPKCQKLTNVAGSLKAYAERGVKTLWAETKYDGERMQIHIDLEQPIHKQLSIFSKSKRDSTKDRLSTHAIIRSALSLPVSATSRPSGLLQQRASRTAPCSCSVTRSVILEAEMVPYNERTGCIEEFWKIVQCPGDQRAGWRKSGKRKSTDAAGASESQHGEDGGDDERHLQLVFFDILSLDDKSLLDQSYEDRRAILENVVKIIPGWTALAQRSAVKLSNGLDVAKKELDAAFAASVSRFEEGLVLKPANATYLGHQWQKMKRDYIPGLGDSVDLVLLGASWDAQRARELNVAPTVMTSFHVGVRIETCTGRPRFLILFKASYGLTRQALDHWNAFFDDRCLPWSSGVSVASTLGYSVDVPAGVETPAVLLRHPLLVELYGASFQKLATSSHYELRWPRIQKIYPPKSHNGGKAWTEAMFAAEYRSTALKALGKEPSDIASSIEQRLESQPRNPESLDIEALFASLATPPPRDLPPLASSAAPATSNLDLAATSKAGHVPKRKRQYEDERWSQRSTTREPESEGEDSPRSPPVKARPQPVVEHLEEQSKENVFSIQSPSSPKHTRVPLHAASPNIIVKTVGKGVDDSGVCLDVSVDLTVHSGSLEPSLPRQVISATPTPLSPFRRKKPKLRRTSTVPVIPSTSTLRHLLESSVVHVPSLHDITLTPPRDLAGLSFGIPLRHTSSAPELAPRSTPGEMLATLGLERADSFRTLLAQPDKGAVLLLDPSSPLFQVDLDAFSAIASAIAAPRPKVRVLNVWCLREKQRGLDEAWERFQLAEL